MRLASVLICVYMWAGCSDTAIVLDVASNRLSGERANALDAICVELDADGSARFGRRYDVTATGNPLPQSLTALASGRAAMQSVVYGERRGQVVQRARQDVAFKSDATLHVPVALDLCAPHPSSAKLTAVPSTNFYADAGALVPLHLPSAGDYVIGTEGGMLTELTVDTKFGIPSALGIGGGSPVIPKGAPPPPSTLALAAADLDGDCRPEVIIATDQAAPAVWRDDGSGLYRTLGNIGGTISRAIATGDVNGDGKVDVVVAGGSEAHVWLGDGSGKFHELDGALAQAPGDATALALADLDGDGNLDLVVGQGSTTAAAALVYLNDKSGGGHFTLVEGALPPLPMRATTIATGDVDGDGSIDLVFAQLGGAVRLYLNRGDAYLDDRSYPLLPDAVAADVPSLLLVDVDGDCLLDLVVARAGAAPLLWLNQGGGMMTAGATLSGSAATSLAADDVDGDGDLDLVLFTTGNSLQLELQK